MGCLRARNAREGARLGAVKRGDIVTVAAGKPRPAVVVQSNHLLPYPMVIVVPFTSELDARPPPFTRLTIDPSPVNGLRRVSQLMIDRIIGLPAATLRPTAGKLDDQQMTEITRLLALWLGIG
jgi:mRNA interferase MazF